MLGNVMDVIVQEHIKGVRRRVCLVANSDNGTGRASYDIWMLEKEWRTTSFSIWAMRNAFGF
jgi:hypothetical protein